MGRPVILGNGSMTVGLNEQGLVHDFYYPYVGLENLTTARSVHHKIGVYIDGQFSWVDSGEWDINVDFETDYLASKISMKNSKLQVELNFCDFVDNTHNIFGRIIKVKNTSAKATDVRLFMHQVFQISHAGRADTALYEPDEHYILDYKGRCCLLIYGQDQNGQSFDQFAVGSYGIEGKEGTFKDAEDGELSGSAVEHASVDSAIRFNLQLSPGATNTVDYWVIAGDSQAGLEKVHKTIKQHGLSSRLENTKTHWSEWFEQSRDELKVVKQEYVPMVKKSLMIIKSHIDRRGGIIASVDSSIYNYGRDYYSYVWPRDGAFVLWPLIRMGYTEEPKKFFEFCRDIITTEGYLMHKYQPDKAIGSTWHPLLHGRHSELAIQEDETAIVIFMLGEYLDYSGDGEFVQSLYHTLVEPAANFMCEFIDDQTGLPHASYDLWEEKFLTNTYTTAVTSAALKVAAKISEKFGYADNAHNWGQVAASLLNNSAAFYNSDLGYFRKGFLLNEDKSLSFDNVLDVSSFYGCFMFDYTLNKNDLVSTVSKIESILLNQSPAGGSPRYEYDHYFATKNPYKGNPWFVTSMWIAQFYVRSGRIDDACKILDWVLAHRIPSGVLSEQTDPESGHILGVAPLVWSHAEFINTVLDISLDK